MLPRPIDLLSQQPPFLFVDEYLELDENHCLAKYTFKEDEQFFKGHFPGNPVVPGVILIEALGQTGIATIGLYCIANRRKVSIDKIKISLSPIFIGVRGVEFMEMVKPGDTIYMSCVLKFFRFNRFEVGGEIYKIVYGEKRIVCIVNSIIGAIGIEENTI